MATVVRKLVTEWVYKVDATQLKAAEAMVKKLGEQIQKQMSAADKLSVRQNNHFAQMTTNYNKLTASMNKFRKAQFRLMNQSRLSSGWGLACLVLGLLQKVNVKGPWAAVLSKKLERKNQTFSDGWVKWVSLKAKARVCVLVLVDSQLLV